MCMAGRSSAHWRQFVIGGGSLQDIVVGQPETASENNPSSSVSSRREECLWNLSVLLRASLSQTDLLPELWSELPRHIIGVLLARNIGDFCSVFLNSYALDVPQAGLRFLPWGETAFSPFADRRKHGIGVAFLLELHIGATSAREH